MGIMFQKVSFIYNDYSKTLALNNLSINIQKENELVFVCGKTGSGKSTFINHLNASLIPTTGQIDILGTSLTQKNYRKTKLNPIRKKVGIVFQFPEYQLFEQTVLKDVMFGPINFGQTKEQALKSAQDALKLVGISDDLLNKSPFTLSGGQMRLVSIASILACNPDILVLDEPTSSLDSFHKKHILEVISNIAKTTTKTIIIITHDMDILYEYSKRVLVFNDANIAYDGDAKSLFNDKNLYTSLGLELPCFLDFNNQLNEFLKTTIKADYQPNIYFSNIKKAVTNNE